MEELNSDFQSFIDFQKTEDGKKEIFDDWHKLKSGYFTKSYIYLEWIVLRILYAMDLNKYNIKSYIRLDDNFKPIHQAGSNKPDIVIFDIKKSYALEITERPILGKIEHYSHIDYVLNEYKTDSCIGILLTIPSIQKIPSEVWNSYNDYYTRFGKLFMTFSIEFLISLINFDNNITDIICFYLEESENIWSTGKSWKEIKNSIILLESKTLKNNSID